MKLSTVLAGKTFEFRSIKEVLAKANEQKSGDILAGIAAGSDLERIAAKEVLSRLLVSDLRENPAVPYEDDEVTRINQDSIDSAVYDKIRNWSMAELREYILSYSTTEEDIKTLSRGLTAEIVAGVCKLMSNLDLIYGANKVRVTATCNTTIGLRGTMSTRLQPNHATDNVEGITASLFEGLSYGCGDALLGLNPVIHRGKFAGAFGSYAWSGEAVHNLIERMRSLKLQIPVPGMRVKLKPTQEDLEHAVEFGSEFAAALLQ